MIKLFTFLQSFTSDIISKILEFFRGANGELSSSRLLTIIFTIQFLYESHLLLQIYPTEYTTFCITVSVLILVLVGKMSAENISTIFKYGRRDDRTDDK